MIHHRLPIFDENSFVKAQKKPIYLKGFGREGIRLQNLKQNSHPCTSFARRKQLNGFRRQKKFTMKACAEFHYRQIAEKKNFLKIPAMHY